MMRMIGNATPSSSAVLGRLNVPCVALAFVVRVAAGVVVVVLLMLVLLVVVVLLLVDDDVVVGVPSPHRVAVPSKTLAFSTSMPLAQMRGAHAVTCPPALKYPGAHSLHFELEAPASKRLVTAYPGGHMCATQRVCTLFACVCKRPDAPAPAAATTVRQGLHGPLMLVAVPFAARVRCVRV